MVGFVTGLVRIVVWVVVTVVWAAVGLVFWVPFLARMMATYTGAVVMATYSGSGHGVAEQGLRTAIEFYPRGFQRINHLLRTDIQIDGSISQAIGLAAVVRFFLEALFAAVFWGALVLAAVRYAGLWPDSRLSTLFGPPPVVQEGPATSATGGGSGDQQSGAAGGRQGRRGEPAPPKKGR